jgi:C4-dicarboxylate-specific signal transduction histidine kinase
MNDEIEPPFQTHAFGAPVTDNVNIMAEARESERRYRETQMEVAHANRVATIRQLMASIAHEVRQPITAALANAQAAQRWQAARPPDLDEVQQALSRFVKNAIGAGDVTGRICNLPRKAPPRKNTVDINEAIREVIELTRGEAAKTGVSVRTHLAEGLPLIHGDRVQLQQVSLNLIINAIEAMSDIAETPRELQITTAQAEPDGVLVAVRDSGPGVAPAVLERLFEAFYTTKPSGTGLGLSICRSIIEAHGGQLWVSTNLPRGAFFHFKLPGQSRIATGDPAFAFGRDPAAREPVQRLRETNQLRRILNGLAHVVVPRGATSMTTGHDCGISAGNRDLD